MNFPEQVFYEPAALEYELGRKLRKQYQSVPWIEIQSHNNIPQLRQNPNHMFLQMKRYLVVGVRKTLRYTKNHKISDYLVPYTSSGCAASCLYCYLVCHYNKCAYLRLFVNREQMMERLLKTAQKGEQEQVFEIGSNSDLILENQITGNLPWTIETFARGERGYLTFPTKFAAIDPLLQLEHKGRTIFRMSVNPESVIKQIELGTSPLNKRINALNRMCEAGYPVGVLIAPIVLMQDWKTQYETLIRQLADGLSDRVKQEGRLELIFMTYSFVHRAIHTDAFPHIPPLYDKEKMTGRGRGIYRYRQEQKEEAKAFLQNQLQISLPQMEIAYVV